LTNPRIDPPWVSVFITSNKLTGKSDIIGTLGLDYTKRKTKLDMESINHLQVHATAIGGVLMGHLEK
jgi:hypothetical protein